jgi:hypothetical protein
VGHVLPLAVRATKRAERIVDAFYYSYLPAPATVPLLFVKRKPSGARWLAAVLDLEEEIETAPADQQIGNAPPEVSE